LLFLLIIGVPLSSTPWWSWCWVFVSGIIVMIEIFRFLRFLYPSA
jgi:hypothetical protein